jgi:hypothetical protein
MLEHGKVRTVLEHCQLRLRHARYRCDSALVDAALVLTTPDDQRRKVETLQPVADPERPESFRRSHRFDCLVPAWNRPGLGVAQGQHGEEFAGNVAGIQNRLLQTLPPHLGRR